MGEPSLALQGAVVSILRTDPDLIGLIAGRIYDRVPTGASFPYVTVGDDQTLPDHADCLLGSTEVFATLHVWSRAIGHPEAKTIAGAIVRALNGAEPSLAPDYALNQLEHDSTRYLDDPDGLTSHGVVVFRALIDEA
jgi:hypothetical protein